MPLECNVESQATAYWKGASVWCEESKGCMHKSINVNLQRLVKAIIHPKMSSENADHIKESVKDYYGKTLQTSDDLQTNACKVEAKKMSSAVKNALKLIHEEVSSK